MAGRDQGGEIGVGLMVAVPARQHHPHVVAASVVLG